MTCSPFCKKLNQIREMLRVAACMTRQHRLLIKNFSLEKYSELYPIHSESFFFFVVNWHKQLKRKISMEIHHWSFASGNLFEKGISVRLRPGQLDSLCVQVVEWGIKARHKSKKWPWRHDLYSTVLLYFGELEFFIFTN